MVEDWSAGWWWLENVRSDVGDGMLVLAGDGDDVMVMRRRTGDGGGWSTGKSRAFAGHTVLNFLPFRQTTWCLTSGVYELTARNFSQLQSVAADHLYRGCNCDLSCRTATQFSARAVTVLGYEFNSCLPHRNSSVACVRSTVTARHSNVSQPGACHKTFTACSLLRSKAFDCYLALCRTPHKSHRRGLSVHRCSSCTRHTNLCVFLRRHRNFVTTDAAIWNTGADDAGGLKNHHRCWLKSAWRKCWHRQRRFAVLRSAR